MLNKLFRLNQNHTDVKTEVLAGITTFLTMIYIVVVNPAILSNAGVPFEQVFMATIIAAVAGTLIMAFAANYPIAIAPGMGLNAYFVTEVIQQDVSYSVILGAVFVSGILFIILSLTSLRETLITAIPPSLKYGITSGIGLFIAFLGLRMSGIIVSDESTLVTLGDLTAPGPLLTVVGLFITLGLIARNVTGGLFIGMFITGIIGFFTGQLQIDGFMDAPPAPVFWDMDIGAVFSNGLYTVIFAFLLVTIFDTTGTMIGVAEQAGFIRKDGSLPRARAALMADASATTVGAMFGTSPSSAYVESSSGVAAGGRTGLTTTVVALLFILSMFFAPVVGAVSGLPAITAPVLIIVGCFMMGGLAKVNWGSFDDAFPAFIIILSMPLTSSIATGISFGFITYPLLKLVMGKGKDVHWMLYMFAIIFILQMVFFPGH
ncbi:putative MFS transporter, AGZA family, xanthine/uracil permease [Halobacillus karajensis]|uniref:Guanine/hypoxanthine permease PbuO n=1 Tax=Halobacillus karajensis TaxID=195088 RepID=A0A024P8T1_9BACI|nr:NCS2 family permease [Halobacillus karajensis]CDQ21189.1 Guanine/hypoxanthine permease PbuO [Halobacillus karajensis]CDQ24747.1 Guanine/hypoxanthine permease PbuO [Halobacillus karajensis]CDQ28893.1 Guanine/hypoxanthine permease PbuO [Halobacillus karajensis]SEH95068.1 putative MFS transporter, AGZA family, xanthine/uracil permease [Halobacillus karajensis]